MARAPRQRFLVRMALLVGLAIAGIGMVQVAPARACMTAEECWEAYQQQTQACDDTYHQCIDGGQTTAQCEYLWKSCQDYAAENYRVCLATGVIPDIPPWIIPP